MAYAAGVDEDSEDNQASTETKFAKISSEADQIRLESARRGAASSGDRPLSPGIVFRAKGIRTIANDLAQGLQQIADEPPGSEQGSVKSEDNRCKDCSKYRVQVRQDDIDLCKCTAKELNEFGMPIMEMPEVVPDTEEAFSPTGDDLLLKAVSKQVITECPECEYCGGEVTGDCRYLKSDSDPRECTMHGRITKVKADIKILTEECKDVWRPQFELDVLINHRTRLEMVKLVSTIKIGTVAKGPKTCISTLTIISAESGRHNTTRCQMRTNQLSCRPPERQ